MTGLGAATSNLLAGYIAQHGGYDASFIFLAIVALAGLLFYALAMSESRPANGQPLAQQPAAPEITEEPIMPEHIPSC